MGKQVGGQVRKEVWELSAAILCVALRMLLLTAFPLTGLPAYPPTRLPLFKPRRRVQGNLVFPSDLEVQVRAIIGVLPSNRADHLSLVD